MRTAWRGRLFPVLYAVALTGSLTAAARAQPVRTTEPLLLHARVREASTPSNGSREKSAQVQEKALRWNPAQTAIIICDMWNQHWCRGATRRVGELAPAMNRAVAAARAKGIFIIHAPSSCMDGYKITPPASRPKTAPKAANLPTHIGEWCNKIPAEEKGIYPIDQSDGGCDDGPQVPPGLALEIADRRHRDSQAKMRSAIPVRKSGTCSRPAESPT